jgi:hypothetical protein
VVPDNLLRFVRFCFAEGCILERDWRGAEAVVAAEREEFVLAVGDPESLQVARQVIEALLVRGKDPADPAAAEARSEFFLSSFLPSDEAAGGLEDRSALSRAELRDGSTRRRQRAFHN